VLSGESSKTDWQNSLATSLLIAVPVPIYFLKLGSILPSSVPYSFMYLSYLFILTALSEAQNEGRQITRI
jgi:hypothetical protein